MYPLLSLTRAGFAEDDVPNSTSSPLLLKGKLRVCAAKRNKARSSVRRLIPEFIEVAKISMSFRLLRKLAFRLFPPDIAYRCNKSIPIWAVALSSDKQRKSFSIR